MLFNEGLEAFHVASIRFTATYLQQELFVGYAFFYMQGNER